MRSHYEAVSFTQFTTLASFSKYHAKRGQQRTDAIHWSRLWKVCPCSAGCSLPLSKCEGAEPIWSGHLIKKGESYEIKRRLSENYHSVSIKSQGSSTFAKK